MALDDLVNDFLKPVKWVDEQVLRQYTKLAKGIEDRGYPAPLLAGYISAGGFFFYVGMHTYSITYASFYASSPPSSYEYLALQLSGYLFGTLGGVDIANTLFDGWRYYYYSDGTTTSKGSANVYEKFAKATRLPCLAIGTYLIGSNVPENGIQEILHTINHPLVIGSFLICLASSMYLKGNDPKVLEKQPFWKTAYDWCKDKVTGIVPEPAPQPVPVSIQSAMLDSYL
jgi:hypothetical protein